VVDVPPHLYEQHGEAVGRDPDVVARASRERSRLTNRGVIPILSLGHLAHLTGLSYGYLREIVERQRDPYVEILRPKPSGGVRTISSPEPPLMAAHRWILRNPLQAIALHPAAYAYRTGRSITQCASRHVGARWTVKLDLHNFFGSIDEARVFTVFENLGYSRLVGFELARICTRLANAHELTHYPSRQYAAIPSYSVGHRGHVPQGAPTSGAIANAVATALDHRLSVLAGELNWTYTRYSDDLTFSSPRSRSRADAVNLVDLVRQAVRSEHFELHVKKTRIVPPGARHVVLGLLVEGSRLRLLPEFKRRIEVHVRGTKNFGLTHHADHRGFRSVFSFIDHVDGCLAFAMSVEPEWVAQVRERWNGALRQNGMPPPS